MFFKQFIEVIEWKDSESERMVYEFPVHKSEIKMGAQLIVRESQAAIFVNEGQIADVFEPGKYTLETGNMPILTKLKSWKYGFNSPFKAEVYFVNTKQFLDQRWGTKNPIMMRDKEFGIIRLRGFGAYAFRITDPIAFMKEVFGSNSDVFTEIITPQLTQTIMSNLTDYIAKMQIPALDLAMHYLDIGKGMLEGLADSFKSYGLTITNFTVQNLSLPPEVEAAMDKRTQMGVLGDLDQYTKYQTAEAIGDAAKNEGGLGAMGAGLGASAAMASAMMGSLNQSNNQQNNQNNQNNNQQRSASSDNKFCTECGNSIPRASKFCGECGTKQ